MKHINFPLILIVVGLSLNGCFGLAGSGSSVPHNDIEAANADRQDPGREIVARSGRSASAPRTLGDIPPEVIEEMVEAISNPGDPGREPAAPEEATDGDAEVPELAMPETVPEVKAPEQVEVEQVETEPVVTPVESGSLTASAATLDSFEVEYFIPVCGNGVAEGSEECDDGNLLSGDGCESDCTIGMITIVSAQAEPQREEVTLSTTVSITVEPEKRRRESGRQR